MSWPTIQGHAVLVTATRTATVAGMVTAVLGRALGAGALAGALSGAVAVLVFVVASLVHPDAGAVRGGELLGATLNYLILAVLIGTTAGAVLAIPVGLVLGALHRSLTGRPGRARATTAAACAAAVLAMGAALSALGTAPGYLSILVLPTLVVAPAVGAWRAVQMVDGTARRIVAEPDDHPFDSAPGGGHPPGPTTPATDPLPRDTGHRIAAPPVPPPPRLQQDGHAPAGSGVRHHAEPPAAPTTEPLGRHRDAPVVRRPAEPPRPATSRTGPGPLRPPGYVVPSQRQAGPDPRPRPPEAHAAPPRASRHRRPEPVDDASGPRIVSNAGRGQPQTSRPPAVAEQPRPPGRHRHGRDD